MKAGEKKNIETIHSHPGLWIPSTETLLKRFLKETTYKFLVDLRLKIYTVVFSLSSQQIYHRRLSINPAK